MILLDHPYVSDLLRHTILHHRLPVVATTAARALGFATAPGAVTEAHARDHVLGTPGARLLSNSENAIGWVAEQLAGTPWPAAVDRLKDKLAFRDLLRDAHPEFHYQAVRPEELDRLDPADIGYPFVIKPAVGFFSLGVHVVARPADWPAARQALATGLASRERPYPPSVLDHGRLIIEEVVTGEEYAIDAYYDTDGEPVITGILHHRFSSQADVGDRVYVTGAEVIEANLARFTAFLADLGRRAGLHDFPVHAEVRVDRSGRIVPIEVNPLRFGGWCTTADLITLAYGFNPYLAFLENRRPDWPALLAARPGKLFAVVVLDNSTGIPAERIRRFDLAAVAARFVRPLAVRPVDHRRYGVFGFLLTETPAEAAAELEAILHDDLRAHVTV